MRRWVSFGALRIMVYVMRSSPGALSFGGWRAATSSCPLKGTSEGADALTASLMVCDLASWRVAIGKVSAQSRGLGIWVAVHWGLLGDASYFFYPGPKEVWIGEVMMKTHSTAWWPKATV